MRRLDGPLTKILVSTAFHNLGIVPIENPFFGGNMSEVLSGSSPDESRASKRKFRKLWRKAARAQRTYVSNKFQAQAGLGCKQPSSLMRRVRKTIVWMSVINDVSEVVNKLEK